ncbi:APC family permease [Actinoplanes sp. NPDC026619]|uniref:APC family permease n=1 Tax=Actinoplanes sp. NPDC026619 TaxID=3155798 RepID=UPI0033E37538
MTSPSPSPGPRLSGRLGPVAIVFMVVAAAAPLTVVMASPIGIALTNGGGIPANYLLAGVILLLFAVGFTTMAHHMKDAGAFYTFVGAGLGRHLGSAAAFLALFTYLAIQTAIYAYLGFSVSALIQTFGGPATSWWLWTLIAIAVAAWLGFRDIDLSAKVLGVLLVLEVLVIVVLSAAVVIRNGVSFDSFKPSVVTSGPLGLGVMMAFGGYSGFESTAIFRDEARDPQRTIPRATYAAVIGIGVFYTLATWLLVCAWGTGQVQGIALDHLAAADLVQVTAVDYVGQWLSDTIGVLICTSLFACAISFHNVVARYLHSLGRSRLLPIRLSATHPVHRSPYRASLLVTGISLALLALWMGLGWDPLTQVFTWISSTGAIGILGLFVLASASVVVFFARTRLDRRVWNTVIAPILALIGLAIVGWTAISNISALTGSTDSGLNAVLIAAPVVALLVGLAVAAYVRRRNEAHWLDLRFETREAGLVGQITETEGATA